MDRNFLNGRSSMLKFYRSGRNFTTNDNFNNSSSYSYLNRTDRPLKKITLERLMKFGLPPLSESKLIESAELTRIELIERVQKRVNAHLSLPFLPASNPHTSAVTSIYSQSLKDVKELSPIRTIEDNEKLVKTLEKMVEDATDVIGMFAKGFKESKKYLTQEEITSFLDRAIKSRISIRLIAEQHLSLSKNTFKGPKDDKNIRTYVNNSTSTNDNHHSKTNIPKKNSKSLVGIVDRQLDVRRTIEEALQFVNELCEGTYGVSPDWLIEGPDDSRVCFIGLHLQYALIEVLKNAFRATVENQFKKARDSNNSSEILPPIEITFSLKYQTHLMTKSMTDDQEKVENQGEDEDEKGKSLIKSRLLCIRIRDYGGGIEPSKIPEVFKYAFTTVRNVNDQLLGIENLNSEDENDSLKVFDFDRVLNGNNESDLKSVLGKIAGLGYGLPMARIYCRYFGGNLELVSIYGDGGSTDTYMTIKVGKSL